MNIRLGLWMLLVVAISGACEQSNPNFQEDASNPEYFHQSMKQLSDVIVHDIFSPPVASRIYAYSSIAAYEAALPGFSDYQSKRDTLLWQPVSEWQKPSDHPPIVRTAIRHRPDKPDTSKSGGSPKPPFRWELRRCSRAVPPDQRQKSDTGGG